MKRDFHRRSIRLAGYDYSEAGAYFVTICTFQRRCIFGEIEKGEVKLSEFGRIAFEQWMKVPERFGNVELGEFVIMPNHLHGIIILHDMKDMKGNGLSPEIDGRPQGAPVRAGLAPAPGLTPGPEPAPAQRLAPAQEPVSAQRLAPAQDLESSPESAPFPKLGDVVGAYKSLVANDCLKIAKSRGQFLGKLWHRNYYEHIIMSDEEYDSISTYIEFNPANWGEKDEYYIEG